MLGKACFVFLVVLLPFNFLFSSEWPSSLTDKDKPLIWGLIRDTKNGLSREVAEYRLTRTIHQHILRDALLLYENEMNPDLVKLTYASFTFDKRGQDAGFGLHVVKQFRNAEKLILVNELWPIENGRLQLPDEIRVRTQAFGFGLTGNSSLEDAENMIGARFRLAWNDSDIPEIYFEPIFEEGGKRIPRKVPISNLQCVGCHSGNHFFAKDFASSDAILDGRQNVQPSYFDKPLEQSKGFIQLRTFLKKSGFRRIVNFKEVESALIDNARKSMELPGLRETLREATRTNRFSSIGSFVNVGSGFGPGVFKYNELIYRDPMREIEEQALGRGRWWNDNRASILLFLPRVDP